MLVGQKTTNYIGIAYRERVLYGADYMYSNGFTPVIRGYGQPVLFDGTWRLWNSTVGIAYPWEMRNKD